MPQATCKNCNNQVDDKYCPKCGQKTDVEKFTYRHIGHEFMHGFLHLGSGLPYTIKELAIRPGRTLREYLDGKRVKHFNPFTFILILSGITAALLSKIEFESFLVELDFISAKHIDQASWNYSIEHFSYRVLVGVLLFSLISRIFYYNKGFNYPEHLIANAYLRGMSDIGLWVISVFLYFSGEQTDEVIKVVGLLIVIVYYGWAYAGLFNERVTFPAFIKGFLCAFLASVLEMLIVNALVYKA